MITIEVSGGGAVPAGAVDRKVDLPGRARVDGWKGERAKAHTAATSLGLSPG
jgi:hypothetical protein